MRGRDLVAICVLSGCSLSSEGAELRGSAAATTGAGGNGGTGTAASSVVAIGVGASSASSAEATAASSSAEASSSATGGALACDAPGGTCCGGKWCNAQLYTCCVEQNGSPEQQCYPHAQGCDQWLDMPCDDTSDCLAGEVCCAHWNQGQNEYTKVECKAQCNPPPSLETGDYPLCLTTMPSCPGQLTCHAESVLGQPHGFCY